MPPWGSRALGGCTLHDGSRLLAVGTGRVYTVIERCVW